MPAPFGRARCLVTAALSDTPYLSGSHPRFCFGFIRGWIRSKSTSTDHDDYEGFYHYTGGRWLWVEKTRLKERYKRFNVSELKRLAAESVGAEKCVGISKLAEGGFNKVFRLVMDNDFIVIARIPNPNAGSGFKATASEVATMHFVSRTQHSKLDSHILILSSVGSQYSRYSGTKGFDMEREG